MRVLRFLTIGLFLLVVPVLFIQTGYYYKLESGITTRTLGYMELVGDMQKERMATFIQSNLDRLDQVTSRRILRELLSDYLQKRDKNIQVQMNRSLLDARYAVASFEEILVADLQGHIIASTDNGLIGKEVGAEEWFLQGKKNNAISMSFPEAGNDTSPYLRLSGALVVDKKVLAVVLVRAKTTELLTILRGPDNLQNGYWELIQRIDAGTLAIIAPDPTGNALYKNILTNEKAEQRVIDSLQGTEGTSFESEGPHPYVLTTRFVPEVGWGLRMTKDASSISLDLANFRNAIVLTGLLLAAFIIGVSLYFSYLLQRQETSPGHS